MMEIPRSQDAVHKAWLYRTLTELLDNSELSQNLCFKGGTCASMLGYLDRFSVDLDFDLKDATKKDRLRTEIHKVIRHLGLLIKDESKNALQFFLKYEAPPEQRNTLKIDINDWAPAANECTSVRLPEIDRTAICQTIETMFANKLVAAIERFEKTGGVAGRDIYDIHYFFIHGYKYKSEIIKERRQAPVENFLPTLIDFINNQVSETVINQDLNHLLPPSKFNRIRKTLKQEVLVFLNDELKRLSGS